MIRRPSKKELFNKIKDGKESVELGRIQIVEPDVILEDATKLGYCTKIGQKHHCNNNKGGGRDGCGCQLPK